MNRNYYDDYGVQSGYNQIAPGRDVAAVRPPQGQPGRPRTATPPAIANAIVPPQSAAPQAPQAPPFRGAAQTIGAMSGNTGVSGYAPGGVQHPPVTPTAPAAPAVADPMASAPAAPAAPAAPDYANYFNTVGQYAPGNGSGYDPSKIADPTHGDSAKYRIGRVLSHFNLSDPALGGLQQPGVQEALNAAHLADNVRIIDEDEIALGGNVDKSMGRTRHLDLINKFASGHGTAGFLQQDKGGVMGGTGAAPAGAPAGGPGFGYLNPAVMTNAIMASGVPQSADYASRIRQQIQAALTGGKQL